MADAPVIVFLDNNVHRIFKSIDTLRAFNGDVKVFNEEREGVDFILSAKTDILFVNLDLYPHDAVSVTKEIRSKTDSFLPFIIIYSDKTDDFVQELAYNSGADAFIGFINKPSILQLFIRNLLKRRTTHVPDPAKKTNGLELDVERYMVTLSGREVQLPRKEFRVFELLFNNPDRYYSKAEIAAEIWGDEKIALKRTIDVHIYNIRQQLGKRVIQSRKGKGYRIPRSLNL